MPILSLITFAPLIGVAAILALRLLGNPDDAKAVATAKWIALVTTLATLALSVLLVATLPTAFWRAAMIAFVYGLTLFTLVVGTAAQVLVRNGEVENRLQRSEVVVRGP